VVRTAFTLIELIFAIVVIGITVISLPTMNQVTSSGLEGNLVQEAIFVASAELNQAVTANWDDNSFEDNSTNSLARVINLTNLCDYNTSLSTYAQKPGHINQPFHRRCLNDGTIGLAAVDNNATLDFGDMEKTNALQGTDGDKRVGYKNPVTTTITVNTNAAFGGANNQDIKEINATIKNNDNEIIITLRAYSANIGEIDYYKRNY